MHELEVKVIRVATHAKGIAIDLSPITVPWDLDDKINHLNIPTESLASFPDLDSITAGVEIVIGFEEDFTLKSLKIKRS